MTHTEKENTLPCQGLVIGASSAIARELISQLLADPSVSLVVAISRSQDTDLLNANDSRLIRIQSDYSEGSIQEIVAQLSGMKIEIERVFICNGILHGKSIFPEKRLEDLHSDAFLKVMQVNALIPMMWVKYLKTLVKKDQKIIFTAFSARVGSIDDNQRGGWYSYRASKAALNMLLKTASIEYSRISSRSKFLAFHPGTTDTPLSQPFQKSVPAEKLFSTTFVVERLLCIVNALQTGSAIQFLDWEGKTVSW